MPKLIAAYRVLLPTSPYTDFQPDRVYCSSKPRLVASQESRKLKDGSLLDRLLLSLKERRNKQFRVQK